MTGFDVLKALGDLDEGLIAEAAERPHGMICVEGKTRRVRRWTMIVAAAACLAIAVGISSPVTNDNPEDSDNVHGMGKNTPITTQEGDSSKRADLPKVNARINMAGGGSYGLWEKDIGEVTANSQNPWTKDCTLTSLPVYENLAYTGGSGAQKAESKEALLQLATETAEAMNRELGEVEYQVEDELSIMQNGAGEPIGEPGKAVVTSLTAKTTDGQVKIMVEGNHEIHISDSSVEMPEEYWVTEEENMNDEEALRIGEFYLDHYTEVLDLEEPTLNFLPTYNIYGRRGVLRVNAFEDTGDELQRILNYNFSQVRFSAWFSEESEHLLTTCENALARSEKLGDYPIITWSQAQEKLLNGEYVDANGYRPKEESIKDVELVYWVSSVSRYYIPYYRFYVELNPSALKWTKESEALGLKQYEACYVPAIEETYIADLETLWGGELR